MADNINVRAGEIGREYVAFLLMERIAELERSTKSVDDNRKYLLDLYVECWDSVGGYRPKT